MTERVLAIALALAVFASALELVIVRHEGRRLFVELQALEKVRDGLNEEWGRLQLEEATWGTHGRVEDLARTRIGMVQPGGSEVILVVP